MLIIQEHLTLRRWPHLESFLRAILQAAGCTSCPVASTYLYIQGVHKLLLRFQKFNKFLFFEIFLFGLFYSNGKYFASFLLDRYFLK